MRKMKRMLFVSRHKPTERQIELARYRGYELVEGADIDAFSPHAPEIFRNLVKGTPTVPAFDAVCVVHPLLALEAHRAGLDVGCFDNVNRAPIGEVPRFETMNLVIAHEEGCMGDCMRVER